VSRAKRIVTLAMFALVRLLKAELSQPSAGALAPILDLLFQHDSIDSCLLLSVCDMTWAELKL